MNDAFYEALATWSQVAASAFFLIFLFVLWVRFIAPAVALSQQRKNAELAEAEQRRDAKAADLERACAEVAAADADIRAIRARAETDSKRLHAALLAAAQAEAERLVRNAEGELERARAAARDRLRVELLEAAMRIAREHARRLDEATDRRLIEGAIEGAERRNEP